MPLPADEQNLLRSVHPPSHQECVKRANEFCARMDLSAAQFGELLRREYGRGGRSTMLIYLRGDYQEHPTIKQTLYMDARVWDFCGRNWPKPKERGYAEQMLETSGCRQIRECFVSAIEEGINSLIYGPPSAEKSFVLETLVAQRHEAGKNDAYHVYCDAGIAPFPLLQRISRAAEVWVSRAWTREHYLGALIEAFARRPYPPAIILDEAQHLPVESLEIIRGLHDRTRRRNRPGCGIILAGSHNLLRDFLHPSRRPRLEQWLSRLPHRIQLSGMTREEVLALAARAWGNGKKAEFTAQQERLLLESCSVEDPYATDANGQPLANLRVYYSARRLLHFIRLRKKKNLKSVLAKEVA